MKLTMNTTVGELLEIPQARAVVEQYAPGVTTHPMAMMLKSLTIAKLVAMPQAAQFGLSQEKAEEMLKEINQRLPQS